MARITYIEHDGTVRSIDAKAGSSVMENAVKNNIPGIVAECGGDCACGTCHVYVDEAWIAKTGAPSATESSTLEFASDVRTNSRLSCQIRVTDGLDGLVVRTPISQG